MTRLFACAFAAFALAACGNAAIPTPAVSGASASGAAFQLIGAPLPALRPATAVSIESAHSKYVIAGKSYEQTIEGTCTIHKSGNDAVGCYLKSAVTIKISKMVSGLYTQPDAKGCLAARGTFHGEVHENQVIPITFLWTGKCS